VNVDGRVMVDPANFRRINPNYTVSILKAEDPDLLPADCNCCSNKKEEDEQATDEETDKNQFDQFETKKRISQKRERNWSRTPTTRTTRFTLSKFPRNKQVTRSRPWTTKAS